LVNVKQEGDVAKNRIFTDKELEEMGRRTLDVLLEAIDAGDKAGALIRYSY
jgi:hypothetical protein